MSEKEAPKCARCTVRVCENRGGKMSDGIPALEKLPGFCPMKLLPEVISEAAAEYDKPAVREFARLASVQESQCFERSPMDWGEASRIKELIQFARSAALISSA